MQGKGLRTRFITQAAVVCLSLIAVASVGMAGMLRLSTQAGQTDEQRNAGLATLMLVAGLRDQVRAQDRAAGRDENNAGAPASDRFEGHHATAQSAIAQLQAPFGANEARLVGEAHRDWVSALRTGDRTAAAGLENALLERLEGLSRGARAASRENVARDAAERGKTLLIGASLLLLAAGGGVALTLVLGLRLASGMENDLGGEPAELTSVARGLALGNLGAADALPSGGGGNLASALKEVALGMQRLVEEVRGNAAQLAHAADTLVSGTAQIAAGSSDQIAAAAGMASSVSQMVASISQVSEHSHTASRVSRESGELSDEASSVVAGASGELAGVAQSALELTEIIQSLGQRSGKISRIVSVIQDIANQTNLLALNAAIEAARAGEQGRGFSVVADEVRKLADRTTESTREISAMIHAIQQGTGHAIEHMEKWSVSVTGGVSKAQGAGERMERVRSGTRDVIEAVDRVSGALAEQSSASDEITAALSRIAAMSQQGSASVDLMNGSAQVVSRLATSLSTLAGQFQAAPMRA